jgi:hypothetical protein
MSSPIKVVKRSQSQQIPWNALSACTSQNRGSSMF